MMPEPPTDPDPEQNLVKTLDWPDDAEGDPGEIGWYDEWQGPLADEVEAA